MFKNNYIRFHLKILFNIYRKIILKSDRKIFQYLFNIKSIILKSPARLKWENNIFIFRDINFPNLRHKIRAQRQCNDAYEFGLINRLNKLESAYFLNEINFQSNDIFIDCGANVGDLKLWFEYNNININYVGFEPSPIEFECLKKNVSPSIVHNVGLWNEEGKINFFISSQGADSSLIEPKEFDEVITVKVKTLNKFINKKIKCLKLEAEGAEPEILEGLDDKIKYVEFISADLGYERGKDCESTLVPVTNFLLEKGFELINMNHIRISALFKNKNLKK